MTRAQHGLRILAIDPSTRGFGFAVMEWPDKLVDWGVKHVRGEKNEGSLTKTRELIRWYEPSLIALEDGTSRGARRRQRFHALSRSIGELVAAASTLRVVVVPMSDVREVVTGIARATKQEVAKALADRYPELAPRLPPRRRPWMSEDARSAIFDAVGLALAALSVDAEGDSET